VAARREIEITKVSEELEWLPDFRFHIPIIRIELTQLSFKRVHVLDSKLLPADRFNALHDLDQPAAGFDRLIA